MFFVSIFCNLIRCLNDSIGEREDYNMILPIYSEYNAITYMNMFKNFFPFLSLYEIERNFEEIFDNALSNTDISNLEYVFPILHFCHLFLKSSAEKEKELFYCNTMLLLIRMKYFEYFDKLKLSNTDNKKYFQVSLNFVWNLLIILETLYNVSKKYDEYIMIIFFITNKEMKIIDEIDESPIDALVINFYSDFCTNIIKCRCSLFSEKWINFFEGEREDIFFRILSLFFMSLYEKTEVYIFNENNFTKINCCFLIIKNAFYIYKINNDPNYCIVNLDMVFSASINKIGKLLTNFDLQIGNESFNEISLICNHENLPTSSEVTNIYEKNEIISYIRNIIEFHKIPDIHSYDFEKIAKICNIIYRLSYGFYSDIEYIQLWGFCLYRKRYLKEVFIDNDFKDIDFEGTKIIVELAMEYSFSDKFFKFKRDLNKIQIFNYFDSLKNNILYVEPCKKLIFDLRLALFFNHFSENQFYIQFLASSDLYFLIFQNNLNLNINAINLLYCKISIDKNYLNLSSFSKKYLEFERIINNYENMIKMDQSPN